jgi:hypothetical protein
VVARTIGAATALALLVSAAALAAEPVRAPKSGSLYEGRHELSMRILGKSIQIVGFNIDCGRKTARTSLSDIPLEKTDRGWRFRIKSAANVTYLDSDRPDENATVRFRGRFSRSAKSVRGVFRVTAPHCKPGDVEWRAFLKSSG